MASTWATTVVAHMMPDILLALTDDKGLMQKVVSNKLLYPRRHWQGGQHLRGHHGGLRHGTEILVNHLTDPQEEGTAQRRGGTEGREAAGHNSLQPALEQLRASLSPTAGSAPRISPCRQGYLEMHGARVWQCSTAASDARELPSYRCRSHQGVHPA